MPNSVVCYRQGGFADYEEDDVAGTCRAAGGDYGGGSETLVVVWGSDLSAHQTDKPSFNRSVRGLSTKARKC